MEEPRRPGKLLRNNDSMQEREDVQGGRASPSAFGDDASDAQF